MLHAIRGARTAAQVGLRSSAVARPSYATSPAASLPMFRARLLSTSPASGLAQPVDKPSGNKQSKNTASASKADKSSAEVSQPDAASSGPQTTALRTGKSAFDIDPSRYLAELEAAEDGSERTGARARGNSPAAIRARNRQRVFTMIACLGLLVGAGWTLGNLSAEWDTIEERQKYANDPSAQGYYGRIRTRLTNMWQSFKEPAWEQLLPDPLPFPYSRPYTLVIDLDKLMVSSKWTRQEGWRTAKRPGLDYFLAYLSNWYEVVLFTRQPFHVAGPIIEKLDPDRRYITYSLFREACKTLDNGHVVKDLSYLNRDLKKVIVIDTEPESVELQPENAILLPKWEGQKGDAELVSLIPFLEAIGIWGIDDVRSTIKAYEGKHIPTEFHKQMRIRKEAEEAEWQRKHGKGNKLGFFGNLRGQDPNAGSPDRPPKSWYEQEQERYTQGYLEDQKYWRENGDALRKAALEDQERQIKEMKMSAWGMLTGQGMKPPEPAAA